MGHDRKRRGPANSRGQRSDPSCFHNDFLYENVSSTVRHPLTDCDVRGAVCLQEAVEMVPNPRDPVDDLHQLYVARPAADLSLNQLPPQVATQEAFHWLHVVSTQNPPDQKTQYIIKCI